MKIINIVVLVHVDGEKINIIDTPEHPDFIAEIEHIVIGFLSTQIPTEKDRG